MQTIGDHPDIVAIETTGYPWGYKEGRKLHECKRCGHEICEGEEYFDINGIILCEECLKRFKELTVSCDWCSKEFDPNEDGFYKIGKEMICPECIEQDCKCCEE